MLSLGSRVETAYSKLLVESAHLDIDQKQMMFESLIIIPNKQGPSHLPRAKYAATRSTASAVTLEHDHWCPVGSWHLLSHPQFTVSN